MMRHPTRASIRDALAWEAIALDRIDARYRDARMRLDRLDWRDAASAALDVLRSAARKYLGRREFNGGGSANELVGAPPPICERYRNFWGSSSFPEIPNFGGRS